MKLTAKHAIAVIILVLSLAAPVVAGPIQDADAAYAKGDYATVLQLMWPLANQGYPGAQNFLGIMYERGRGVPQDYAEALRWYRRAADQGYAWAQYNLAGMYQAGNGVDMNYVEAVKWWRIAADQGNAAGQFLLGVMYQRGMVVPQDVVRAHMWFNLAAARGQKSAGESRDEVEQRMTTAQIAEAQKLAREWRPTTH
jgi:TPR repeat protein